jgi:2-methylcitrate dehydratase PrpD
MNAKTTPLLSDSMAAFVVEKDYDSIPEAVRRWAKLLILDTIGNAYASTRYEFAHKALSALSGLGSGNATVIGMPVRLALRDAVLMNGTLAHGLDYDDIYLPGGLHLSASCVPTALALAEHAQASGQDFLTACVLGLEAGLRLGAAGKGRFLKIGFHPTSLIGTFASALVAGRLMQMSHKQLMMAQGLALSFASGNMQPTQEGAWAKRAHAGWAGAAGITAASMAKEGFTGPLEAYEGVYGLFSPCFLGKYAPDADLNLATHELGQRWELPRSSIKAYPVCYHSAAFMNAAIELKNEERLDVAKIESVHALVAETAVPFICEPLAAKRKPHNSYASQFSLPYAIACCLSRGRFGLEETEESAYSDPGLLALAQKFSYGIDPNSGWPNFRSGEIIVRMKNGREISKRKNILPDEQVAETTIFEKFMDNTRNSLAPSQARKIFDTIHDIESVSNFREITRLLAGRPA